MIEREIRNFKSPKIYPTLSTPWGTLSFRGFVKIPYGWRCGYSPAFRALEWAYPLYSGAERIGLFECVLEGEERRSERVFLWRHGHTYLTCVERPKHLRPEPLPANAEVQRQYNSQRKFYLPQKRTVQEFARVTYHRNSTHILQRYHYGKVQETQSRESPFLNANNNGQFANWPVSSGMVKGEKNTGEWWSREQTCEDISRVGVPIIPNRHLSTEHTVIGKGSFGTVAIRTLTGGRQVVTKSFHDDISSDDILIEARLLAFLSDTCFVPTMFGVSYSSDFRLSIVQEYCASGVTLFDVLTNELYSLSNHTWLTIINQMVQGLRDIHRKGVLLNDLKEDNILVDCRSPNVRVVFIDFGLATFKQGRLFTISEEEKQHCAHLAPEILAGQPTRPSSDVYSLGRMLENISFECDLCGLCDIADGCLNCEAQRPSTDCLVEWVNKLDPRL